MPDPDDTQPTRVDGGYAGDWLLVACAALSAHKYSAREEKRPLDADAIARAQSMILNLYKQIADEPQPAPTTQRSPLPLAEQARISGLVIHDTLAALGAEGKRHLDLWASELRGRLATVQLSLESLWQGQPIVTTRYVGDDIVQVQVNGYGIATWKQRERVTDEANGAQYAEEVARVLRLALQDGDDVYHEGAEAIGKAVWLVDAVRRGK